jgi:hypothetical protein
VLSFSALGQSIYFSLSLVKILPAVVTSPCFQSLKGLHKLSRGDSPEDKFCLVLFGVMLDMRCQKGYFGILIPLHLGLREEGLGVWLS